MHTLSPKHYVPSYLLNNVVPNTFRKSMLSHRAPSTVQITTKILMNKIESKTYLHVSPRAYEKLLLLWFLCYVLLLWYSGRRAKCIYKIHYILSNVYIIWFWCCFTRSSIILLRFSASKKKEPSILVICCMQPCYSRFWLLLLLFKRSGCFERKSDIESSPKMFSSNSIIPNSNHQIKKRRATHDYPKPYGNQFFPKISSGSPYSIYLYIMKWLQFGAQFYDMVDKKHFSYFKNHFFNISISKSYRVRKHMQHAYILWYCLLYVFMHWWRGLRTELKRR